MEASAGALLEAVAVAVAVRFRPSRGEQLATPHETGKIRKQRHPIGPTLNQRKWNRPRALALRSRKPEYAHTVSSPPVMPMFNRLLSAFAEERARRLPLRTDCETQTVDKTERPNVP